MKNKLIKSILIFAAWVIPVALLAWFAYTLIQNTKTQPQEKNQEIQITVNFNNKPVEGTETVETTRQVPAICPFSGEMKTSEVKTVVKTTKSEPSERRVVITEDAFKETMQQVAYSARLEAQNEYDKNFATLLTILAIFGIAWPVLMQILQFKFNEKSIDQINKSEAEINSLQKKFEDSQKETAGAMAFNFEALANAYRSDINTYGNDPANRKVAVINCIIMTVNAITRHCEAGDDNVELARKLTMRLYEEQNIFGDIEKIDISAIKNIDSFKETLGQMHYDIFKTVYNRYFIQQLP